MGAELSRTAADGAGLQLILRGLFPVLLIPQYAGPVPQVLEKDGQQQDARRHARHDKDTAPHSRHPLISSLWVTVFTYSVPPRAYRASEMSVSFW